MLAENASERSQIELALENESSSEFDVIVIGSGPVGMRFIDVYLSRQPNASIMLFGNEPYAPYNRVQLSSLLAGDITRQDINLSLPSEAEHPNFQFEVASIKHINRPGKTVTDSLGNSYAYKHLVIATGARAHIPDITGIEKNGVYKLRSLLDTEKLAARITRSRNVVVLGGGLLGVEAAKAMSRAGTKVVLIQQGPHLMNRQLDTKAAELLKQEIESLGIEVITHSGVREIQGNGNVTGVKTQSKQHIACDTVLSCAGIKPNIELALQSGLPVGSGIVVNERLQTADEYIYAIGECCEYEGETYGLVNPGFEQAAIAADTLAKASLDEDTTAIYQGSASISHLKVVGQQVCSMGPINDPTRHPLTKVYTFDATGKKFKGDEKNAGKYRKLIVNKHKLVAALSYGEWPESRRVQNLFTQQETIWPWQLWRFKTTGRIWREENTPFTAQLPDEALICQCNAISKGALNACISQGCQTPTALMEQTGAGTVCGSCKPLVAELVELSGDGQAAKLDAEQSWKSILITCFVALCVVLGFALTPEARVSESVQTSGWFEAIWNDKFWKQVTGFTLLGLTAIGLLMSLRKRLNWTWMGKYNAWRWGHMLLGTSAAALLMLHTGFHTGENLNQLLITNFLAVLILGALTGTVISLSHTLKPSSATSVRKGWTWLHIVISWPLPALLIAHIVSVYYY